MLPFCCPFYTAGRSRNEFQKNERSLLSPDSTAEIDSLKKTWRLMPAILFSAFCSAGNIFLLLLLDKTNGPPSIQHLPSLSVYWHIPWSALFTAHFLVRCDSSLQIMKAMLTKMICVAFALDVIPAYFASVTLLGQDLSTRSLQTAHLAHGSQARCTDHRAN